MTDREQVFQAIRDSWSPETCGEHEKLPPHKPSWQQCEASTTVWFTKPYGGSLGTPTVT
ncbi:MAG: hypothetical protein GY788_25760 [bacterium]|nr:hypothetical protein [bacterium]